MSIDRNNQLENLFSVMNSNDSKDDKKILSNDLSLSEDGNKPLTPHEALQKVIKITTMKKSEINDVTKKKIKKKVKDAFIEFLEMFYLPSFDENKL